MSDLAHELIVAERLARHAGEMILSMRGKVATRYKTSKSDPVTEADEAADALLVAGIKKEFPHDAVISEESFTPNDLLNAQRTWYLDPIDGTADYVVMGEDFSVMMGLLIDFKPMLGVVYQPTSGILWRADCLSGRAERVDEKGVVTSLDVAHKSLAKNGPIVVLSKHHPSPKIEEVVKRFGVSKLVVKGSIGLRAALIAEGSADVYVTKTNKVKLWDTCGPHAILNAAGGYFTNIYGEELDYKSSINHQHGIVAAIQSSKPWLDNVRNALMS